MAPFLLSDKAQEATQLSPRPASLLPRALDGCPWAGARDLYALADLTPTAPAAPYGLHPALSIQQGMRSMPASLHIFAHTVLFAIYFDHTYLLEPFKCQMPPLSRSLP